MAVGFIITIVAAGRAAYTVDVALRDGNWYGMTITTKGNDDKDGRYNVGNDGRKDV